MQVFKVYFKVIQKNLNQIVIYIGIFLLFAVLLTNLSSNSNNAGFSDTKSNIAFISNDKSSKLVDGLKDYLNKNTNIINIPDNTQKLQDALFFRQVDYIVKVPDGFTDGLLNGKDVQLQKTTVPGSTSSFYMDSLIDKYLNTARTYSDSIKNISQDQLVSNINKDLSQKTQVDVTNFNKQTSKDASCSYYFNYMAYSLFSVLILGVCSVMIVFNDTEIKSRNSCSPIKLRNMNLQLVLGNLSFALISWLILLIPGFIMYSSYMFTANGLLLLLNSLLFTVAALSISFLIGNVIKSRGAMSAAANVIALGSSFISGVFVPQMFLGKTVLTIASFTPTYWYVKSNNAIVDIVNFKLDNLMPVFLNMLIVLGFAVAVLAVTLVFTKQKRMSS
jgi:ABC-2 type transport system permease protein